MACGALAAVLLLACGYASAQWKWRDERGRITVSDTPPPREIPDKDILQRPETLTRRLETRPQPPGAAASAPPSAPAASQPSEREIAARRRAEAEQQARQKEEEARQAAQRAETCRQARAQLAALESGDRLARYNEKGEREVLDDAARAAEIRRTRDFIAAECR